jgi:hypothetical protein
MRPVSSLTSALAAGALLAALAGGAPPAAAATAEAKDVKALGAKMSATGTITSIDTAKREVTIRNADGEEHVFSVGPKVHLERAKVGDKIRVDYNVGVAIALKKGGGEMREKVEAQAASHTPSSATPSVQATSRTTIVADVLAVDKAKQMVRLKGPEGRVADVKVEDKAALADVAVGDQVIAVVTEEVAVTLVPQHAAAAASGG